MRPSSLTKKTRKKSRNLAWISLIAIAIMALDNCSVHAESRQGQILTGPVMQTDLHSSINPGTLEQLKEAIKTARLENASLLLVTLDTPGGLVVTLRKMVQAVMGSPVPICVFVYPSGAQAASAGALLTLSAHIAAMAPGTNIGAAHPVNFTGDLDANSTMARKLENDLAALAISIAEKRGRNTRWAEDAVRKSLSVSASTALKEGVIDLIAETPAELIKQIRGRKVVLSGDKEVVISPRDTAITVIEPSIRQRILQTISDPNIAYILMMLGMLGIYFEFAHPGMIFPGTIGAMSIILALYALHTLSASITGILLLLLAFILFILELFITSHGILAVSGIISLTMGSIMLFDNGSGLAISTKVLWPTLALINTFFITIALLVARASLKRPKTGIEALAGQQGVVKKLLDDGSYMVFIRGELWRAHSDRQLNPGDRIEVISAKGLELEVSSIKDQSE